MEATNNSTAPAGISSRIAIDHALLLAGRNLAVVVLNELAEAGEPKCSIAARDRDGEDQCDSLARAIRMLQSAPQDVIRGFAAVFTEILGREDSLVTSGWLERLTAAEIIGEPVAQSN